MIKYWYSDYVYISWLCFILLIRSISKSPNINILFSSLRYFPPTSMNYCMIVDIALNLCFSWLDYSRYSKCEFVVKPRKKIQMIKVIHFYLPSDENKIYLHFLSISHISISLTLRNIWYQASGLALKDRREDGPVPPSTFRSPDVCLHWVSVTSVLQSFNLFFILWPFLLSIFLISSPPFLLLNLFLIKVIRRPLIAQSIYF